MALDTHGRRIHLESTAPDGSRSTLCTHHHCPRHLVRSVPCRKRKGCTWFSHRLRLVQPRLGESRTHKSLLQKNGQDRRQRKRYRPHWARGQLSTQYTQSSPGWAQRKPRTVCHEGCMFRPHSPRSRCASGLAAGRGDRSYIRFSCRPNRLPARLVARNLGRRQCWKSSARCSRCMLSGCDSAPCLGGMGHTSSSQS